MANNKLSPELQAELARLALIADEDIDTSEMPETVNWRSAKRGLFSDDQIEERAYDVRALANWFLDRASALRLSYSNMSLNKLVYLALERALVERRVLLAPARVEAWNHGPVFREVYQAFNDFGEKPIDRRAQRFDVGEKQMVEAREKLRPEDEAFLENIFDRYGKKSAAQLRAISHIEGGPWDTVWRYRGKTNPGMEITPAIIFQNAPKLRDVDEK